MSMALAASSALAQAWPQRPIKIIVPYTVGGASDITARLLADRLSTKFGQAVTVENRAGASGIIGTDAVAKAAPDGYTLAFVASSHVINKAVPQPPLRPDQKFCADHPDRQCATGDGGAGDARYKLGG